MGSLLIMGVMMGVMGVVGLGSLWQSRRAPAKAPAFAVSPVSSRRLAVTPATPRAVVGGKTFFFEDEEQQRAFVLDLGAAAKADVYSCSMRDYSGPQTKDGRCPKCGMSLSLEK